MLIIKKSKIAGYILYDSKDFALHAHINDLSMARTIKANVAQSKLPHTHSKWLIYCHIRVTRDKAYKDNLYAILKKQ